MVSSALKNLEFYNNLWENDLPMDTRKIATFIILILVLLFAHPLYAETISLKLSFNTNSYADGDLKTWIQSANQYWGDYGIEYPGTVTGEFIAPTYGSNIEIEVRIPIYKGFGINFAGSRFSGSEEGDVSYVRSTGLQEETQYLSNEVSGLNLKIGFSYRAALPFLEGLHLFGNVGRHLVYAKYSVINNYFGSTEALGSEFTYEHNQENSFNSDALGWYAGLGFEYDVIQHVAIVLEIEKIWSKVNGFKGSHFYEYITTLDGIVDEQLSYYEEENASLYFFEEQLSGLDTYYQILNGDINKPEGELIRNLRSGELNFSTLSVKFGIRFKF